MRTDLWVLPDPATAAEAAARRLLSLGESARRRSGRFAIAVSGGRTPEPMFRFLAQAQPTPEWSTWEVFWADERLIPREDANSNYRQASERWLDPVGLPPERRHPIPVSAGPEEASRRYERELRAFFGDTEGPTFDVVALGVGPDGHTASLFPGAPTLRVRERWVAGEPRPRQPPAVPRVTLTLPALRRARTVVFLVCGREKRDALTAILEPARAPAGRAAPPAALVTAVESVQWFIDADAAPTTAPAGDRGPSVRAPLGR